MTKIGINILIIVFVLLFIAPWYQTGSGREDILEHRQDNWNTRVDENGKRVPECNCDGPCIYGDTHWVPFGVLISDCSHDAIYKIFFGPEFHIGPKAE